MSTPSSCFEPQALSPQQELWHSLALKALKGAGLESLQHLTADGLMIEPFYPHTDCASDLQSGRDNGLYMARIDDAGEREALDQACEEVENGAQGLQLIGAQGAGAYGLGILDPAVASSLAPLWAKTPSLICEIDAGSQSLRFAQGVLTGWAQGQGPAVLHAGLDPLGGWCDKEMRIPHGRWCWRDL
jgi:methylmalonyl-CoA mutase